MSLITGTRVGPFEVLGVIGAGGMGVVYKARDVRLGRDVALKSLPANWRDDSDRLARLQREAQILASLNHPHIAGIHGIEEADGTLFLVLEFIDGETLAARLGSLSISETLSIARQIADALDAAHEKGIVHRDLKPGNVAVTRDGEVKVFDFGLAKVDVATSASAAGSAGHHALSQSPTTLAAMTTPGMAIGTPLYMSPEQVRGRPTDRRTDIWAFGCVLYAMLTGKPPFGGRHAIGRVRGCPGARARSERASTINAVTDDVARAPLSRKGSQAATARYRRCTNRNRRRDS
jgi:serine/threonine protein kinase